jgi:hypothetical protein
VTCAELEAQLDELLRAEPTGPAAAHLAACPSCAALLEERRAVVAALVASPRPEPPPALEQRLRAASRRRRRLAIVAGSGTLVVAGAIGLVLAGSPRPDAPVTPRPGAATAAGFAARGAAQEPTLAPTARLALLCYDAPDALPDPSGHCRLDQLAGIALRRGPALPGFLAVFGWQGTTPRYYFPSPLEPRSLRTPGRGLLEPVGPLIRLSVHHTPGPLRLVGLLSPRPRALPEAEAAARGPAPPGVVRLETTVILRENQL